MAHPASLPLQQSPQFARALEAVGVTLVSRAPLVIERHVALMGPVRFASRVDVAGLLARPRVLNAEFEKPASYRAAGYRQIITPAHIANWDLTQPDRRAQMSGKWRNQLHKGIQANLRVREVKWDGSPHWLFEEAAKLAKERRFRALPDHILAAYAARNPNDAVIFEAYDQGHPVAACLILRHGPTATYQTAYTTPRGKTVEAARVLLDNAATRLATWGHEGFDLGLVETDNAAGLTRFKLGTGATVRRLGGTWLRLP